MIKIHGVAHSNERVTELFRRRQRQHLKHHKHEHATMTTRAKVWLLDSQAVLYKVQVNNELNHKEEEYGQHDYQ